MDINRFLGTYSEMPVEISGKVTDIFSGKDDDPPALAKAVELAKKQQAPSSPPI